MRIYFLCEQDFLLQFRPLHSEFNFVEWQFFSKIGEFLKATRSKMPHIVFVDFYLFNDEFFCLQEFFDEQKILATLLYLNNPKVPNDSRPNFWLHQISSKIFESEKSNCKKVFDAVASKVYVLGGDAKTISEDDSFDSKRESKNLTDEDFLYRFRKKNKVSKKPFFLLKCLYRRREKVSVEDLIFDFEKENMPISKSMLSLCISRLRKYINEDANSEMDLVREGDGYRLIVFDSCGGFHTPTLASE